MKPVAVVLPVCRAHSRRMRGAVLRINSDFLTWNLRADGVIEVTAIGFTQTQKNTATTWISNNMPGEVVIL